MTEQLCLYSKEYDAYQGSTACVPVEPTASLDVQALKRDLFMEAEASVDILQQGDTFAMEYIINKGFYLTRAKSDEWMVSVEDSKAALQGWITLHGQTMTCEDQANAVYAG